MAVEKANNLETDSSLGHYRIIKKLGEGGMGEVFLAEDTRLDRRVALKVLPENLAGDADRMRRFVREAKATSALNHPNILTIYEIGESGNTNYIAAEYIEGETLRERLRGEPLGLKAALDVAVQVTSAMQAAHGAGIVHRDIKPENVMIRPDGLAKLLDFGIAKLTENQTEPLDAEAATAIEAHTKTGMLIGTAAYMSPEQASGKKVDARSDIFSFGLVLYEMLSGRAAFEGESAMETIGLILHKEPLPLSRQIPDVPHEIERIVGKALRKDCEERYQTAKDLLIDLKDARQDLELQNKPERTNPPQQEESKTQIIDAATTGTPQSASSVEYVVDEIKSHKLGFVALSVLIVAAAGLGYWYFFSHMPDKQIESIAVMPFVNESGNADTEYLSDGMTETLISSLSQLPKLNVKARSSVFRYKGKDTNAQTIAQELNVQAILTGKVIQRGQDLSLYVELVNVALDKVIWSETYNRPMTNLVVLQKDIARDVSSNLQTKLSGADERKLTKIYTANAEAYQLYLRGRYHVLKLRQSETNKAISYFQQAIAIDPSYALAYVGLAASYRSFPLAGEMSPTEFFPKAKAAAQRAVEIDNTLAEAHAALGYLIFRYDWNWSEAEKECKRALELDPNSAEVYETYAHLFSTTGRHTEALAAIKRARELDPLNLRIGAVEAQFLIYAGKIDEALFRSQKTIELDPDFWFAHNYASSAYIEKGMYAEAIAEARKARALNDGTTHPTAFLGYALAKSGNKAEARAELEALLKLSTARYVPPYHIALIYSGLNETDETIAWLERGFRQRDPRMVFLKVEPKWNNLRDDPRFQDILRRVGFP